VFPLAHSVKNHFYKGSKILVTNYKDIGASEIRAWCNVPVNGVKEPFRGSSNYNKLSYNSAFPWQEDSDDGVVSMNYLFEIYGDTIRYEPGRLYSFHSYDHGTYHRTLQSENIKGVEIKLSETPLANGILRRDVISSDKALSIHLGSYALPNINGTITTSIEKKDGHQYYVINNGEYELAMSIINGFSEVQFYTTQGLHPEAQESVVINATSHIPANTKGMSLDTKMTWRKL